MVVTVLEFVKKKDFLLFVTNPTIVSKRSDLCHDLIMVAATLSGSSEQQ